MVQQQTVPSKFYDRLPYILLGGLLALVGMSCYLCYRVIEAIVDVVRSFQ